MGLDLQALASDDAAALSQEFFEQGIRRLAKINCLVWDVISAQDCNSSRRGTCPA